LFSRCGGSGSAKSRHFPSFQSSSAIPNRFPGSETTLRAVCRVYVQLSRIERPEHLHRDGLNQNALNQQKQKAKNGTTPGARKVFSRHRSTRRAPSVGGPGIIFETMIRSRHKYAPWKWARVRWVGLSGLVSAINKSGQAGTRIWSTTFSHRLAEAAPIRAPAHPQSRTFCKPSGRWRFTRSILCWHIEAARLELPAGQSFGMRFSTEEA